MRECLRLVDDQGADLAWHVITNARGIVNKVAFGTPPAPFRYFYLYADGAAGEPYAV